MNITTKIALVVTTIIAITMGIVISMAVSDAEEILRSQLEHSLAVKVSYFDTWLGQHALQIERTAEVLDQRHCTGFCRSRRRCHGKLS